MVDVRLVVKGLFLVVRRERRSVVHGSASRPLLWCSKGGAMKVPAGESDGSMAGGVGIGIAGRFGMATTAIASMTHSERPCDPRSDGETGVSPGGAGMGRSALVRLRTICTPEV
jgi:hypothetical protein